MAISNQDKWWPLLLLFVNNSETMLLGGAEGGRGPWWGMGDGEEKAVVAQSRVSEPKWHEEDIPGEMIWPLVAHPDKGGECAHLYG